MHLKGLFVDPIDDLGRFAEERSVYLILAGNRSVNTGWSGLLG